MSGVLRVLTLVTQLPTRTGSQLFRECAAHRPHRNKLPRKPQVTKPHKRFIYWDECRPVELAARGTVPVGTFLSLFSGGTLEITVSQSFQNGNAETRWRRGAAMTAKEEGLWDPVPCMPGTGLAPVSHEDIRHMKSRVRRFPARAPVPDGPGGGEFATVPECGESFCRWLVFDAGSFASAVVERPLRQLPGRALPPLPEELQLVGEQTEDEAADVEVVQVTYF